MAKTRTEKIDSIQEEIKQLENKRKQLIQAEKVQERKDRTKRLCKRMGLIESLLPETIPLSEEQFKTFLEKTIITEHSRRILDGLTTQNAVTATQESAETAAQDNTPPIYKPAQIEQDENTGGSGNEGNGARING